MAHRSKWLKGSFVSLLVFTFTSCTVIPTKSSSIEVPVEPLPVYSNCTPDRGEAQRPELRARGHAYDSEDIDCI